MNSSNKNIRHQRSSRAARLKSKIDGTSKQVQQFSQTYFEIPLPEHHSSQSQFNCPTGPSNPSLKHTVKTFMHQEVDERKENIKQKIKFRVKQELWNLLKKNNERISTSTYIEVELPVEKRRPSQSVSFVMGRSFTRFTRDTLARRNEVYSEV